MRNHDLERFGAISKLSGINTSRDNRTTSVLAVSHRIPAQQTRGYLDKKGSSHRGRRERNGVRVPVAQLRA